MAPDSMVVEDGVEERGPRRDAQSSWLLVAVAFVLGLALGTLAPVDQDVNVGESPDPTAIETPVGAAADESESGISDFMAEFPDALVAVVDGVGSGHDYLLWPVKGPLLERSMTGGSGARLDATGASVALSDRVPGLDGVILSMGRFHRIRAVASGVTSYAWHDASSGALAFTTESDGDWLLHRVAANFIPTAVVSGPADGRSVAAWGDWGFAVQTTHPQVVLLTPAGELKATEAGVALASHESGWLLVEDGDLKLVSAGGGVRRLRVADASERIFAAAFSPDGDLVAMARRTGVHVYDLAGGEEIANLAAYPGDWIAWSSDSRFIVAPARSGIVIHDLETGSSLTTLVGHKVIVSQVRPLSTS